MREAEVGSEACFLLTEYADGNSALQESSFVLQEETVACDLIALSKIGNDFSLMSHVSVAETRNTIQKMENLNKESEVYLSDTESEDLFTVLL